MTCDGKLYRVVGSLWRLPLPDHLEHGYEDGRDFRHALWQLVDRWGGREGECVEERHGHLRLRFHDTPGGMPDEAWLPGYLLQPVDESGSSDGGDESILKEMNEAFGFD